MKVCDPAPGLPGPAWSVRAGLAVPTEARSYWLAVCEARPRINTWGLRRGQGRRRARFGAETKVGAEARFGAEFWAASRAHRWRLPKGRVPDLGLHLRLHLCLHLCMGHTVP